MAQIRNPGDPCMASQRTAQRERELDQAWELMHFALRAVIASPDQMLEKRGLSRVHHRILFFVARQPDLIQLSVWVRYLPPSSRTWSSPGPDPSRCRAMDRSPADFGWAARVAGELGGLRLASEWSGREREFPGPPRLGGVFVSSPACATRSPATAAVRAAGRPGGSSG